MTLFGCFFFFHSSCGLKSCEQNTRFGTGTVRPRKSLSDSRGCSVLRMTYSNPDRMRRAHVSGIPPRLQGEDACVAAVLCSESPRGQGSAPQALSLGQQGSVLALAGLVPLPSHPPGREGPCVCLHPELWGCAGRSQPGAEMVTSCAEAFRPAPAGCR